MVAQTGLPTGAIHWDILASLLFALSTTSIYSTFQGRAQHRRPCVDSRVCRLRRRGYKVVHAEFLKTHLGEIFRAGCDLVADGPIFDGIKHTGGLCVVDRESFDVVRGYDEAIHDYGHEDTDFYRRCDNAGFRRGWLHFEQEHDRCSDEERTMFYAVKDLHVTIAGNGAQIADSSRPVNSRGWGLV